MKCIVLCKRILGIFTEIAPAINSFILVAKLTIVSNIQGVVRMLF